MLLFPFSAGNVFETKMKDIWDNSPLFNDLRDFKSYEGKCGVCKYLGVCGGCRARAYAVEGSYMKEEPFCDYILKLCMQVGIFGCTVYEIQ